MVIQMTANMTVIVGVLLIYYSVATCTAAVSTTCTAVGTLSLTLDCKQYLLCGYAMTHMS